MKLQWVVTADEDGRMLRTFVRRSDRLSASLWRRVKWNGRVTVNGEAVHNARLVVHAGDVIVCEWQEERDIVPCHIPLSVLYEDDSLLIVNKGAGMIIHPTHRALHDSLVNAVAGYFEETGEEAGIHPVYRLDRNTTGIVVVAKSAQVQWDLSRSHDRIARHYLAVCAGHMPELAGVIEAPVGRKPGSIVEWMVREDGRFAKTAYEVIARGRDGDFLRLRLYTGRTHQIRVHLSWLGHPLLGDDLYGGPCKAIGRQALHASTAEFIHPHTGQPMAFTAPLPDDMRQLAEAMTPVSSDVTSLSGRQLWQIQK